MKSPFSLRSVTITCALSFLFIFSDGAAQFDNMGINGDWKKGSIVLDDNSSRKGLIQFNDKLGMIKFREDPKSAEESFVETSIVSMQLYDNIEDKWRNFAVFNLNEDETGKRYSLLFEVLIEFRKFALLSRVQKVNVAVRSRSNDFGNSYLSRVGYEQFSYLCLVNDEGTATVVLRVNEFERKKLSTASKIKPYLNKKALERYLGNDWDLFQTLVETHDLNVKNRQDLIEAFEYLHRATEKDL